MGRRKLGIGEVASISITATGRRKYRGRAYTRLRDGSRVLVQASGTSKETTEANVREAARKRAMIRTDGEVGPQSKLGDVALESIELRLAAGEISATSAQLYRGDVARAGGREGITDMRMEDCDRNTLHNYLVALSRRSPSTAKRLRSVLREAFKFANTRGARLDDPAPLSELKLAKGAAPQPRALTVSELDLLRSLVADWQAGDPRRWKYQREAIEVQLGTGIRPGELLALGWEDVDLVSTPATIKITGTIVRIKGHGSGKGARRGEVAPGEGVGVVRQDHPKTQGSRRTIPLTKTATDALMRMRVESPGNHSGLVFAARTGGPIDPHNYGRRWREIVKGTELDWVTPHVLRKTVATIIAREVDPETAAAILGNNLATVKLHYIEREETVVPDHTAQLQAFADSSLRKAK